MAVTAGDSVLADTSRSGTPGGWRPWAPDTTRQAPEIRQTASLVRNTSRVAETGTGYDTTGDSSPADTSTAGDGRRLSSGRKRPRSGTPAGWRPPASDTAGAPAPADPSPVRNTGRVADTGTGHDTAGDSAPADSVPGPEHWHGRGYWHRPRHGWLLSSRSQRTQSGTPVEWRPPAPDTTWQAPQLRQIASPVRNTSRVAATGTGHDTAGASAPADSIHDTEHQHRTRHGRRFIASRKRPGSEH